MHLKKILFTNLLLLLSEVFLNCESVKAQFSPGDLCNAHMKLEGAQNCTKCHEIGKEISGAKCLGCHDEIKILIDSKRGLHAKNASEQCVKCHQEHLGRNAKTVQFDENNFDHTQTGFKLIGRHAVTECNKCHIEKYVKEPTVKKKLADFPHKSFLGLNTACISCHEDHHRGQLSQDCSACHSTVAWNQIQNFDHSKAKFPLQDKHLNVACTKCHPSLSKEKQNEPIDFKTVSFSDCSPCHSSPHVSKFNGKECSVCHNVKEWSNAIEKPFEHNFTRYKLNGKHALLKCDECHKVSEKRNFLQTFLISYNKCTDCHTDKHNGEFLRKYNNDCSLCHTVNGYQPSTFTIDKHNQGKFKLTGAHLATICSGCHLRPDKNSTIFYFENNLCESCHKDVHKGEFTALMKEQSCAKCHTTVQWKSASFDHSKTAFPLIGKHAYIRCQDCHKEVKNNGSAEEFKKISTECQLCHKDIHRNQFAISGKTKCDKCHSESGWKILLFNHETQSIFHLTGAHKKVACNACHPNEKDNDTLFIRFKPIGTNCEFCHNQGIIR